MKSKQPVFIIKVQYINSCYELTHVSTEKLVKLVKSFNIIEDKYSSNFNESIEKLFCIDFEQIETREKITIFESNSMIYNSLNIVIPKGVKIKNNIKVNKSSEKVSKFKNDELSDLDELCVCENKINRNRYKSNSEHSMDTNLKNEVKENNDKERKLIIVFGSSLIESKDWSKKIKILNKYYS